MEKEKNVFENQMTLVPIDFSHYIICNDGELSNSYWFK